MEEVDSIIVDFLRQLDIDFDDNLKSLTDMPVDVIIESVSKCLRTIDPTLRVPIKLPPGVSQRIEVAAQIATFCKDLGYKNEVGYQTFLYCNQNDLRQVFMFLIEHLPNENKTAPVVSRGEKSQLFNNISKKIEDDLNTIWVPQCCYTKKNRIGDAGSNTAIPVKSSASKIDDDDFENILKKLQEISTTKKSAIEEKTNCISADNKIEESGPLKAVSNKSLKELKETAIVLRQSLNKLETERNIMDVEFSQKQTACQNAEAELKEVLNILRSIGLTSADMDSIGNVLEKVQKNIAALHSKSEQLTSKNLSIKLEIEKCRKESSFSQFERNQCRNTLISLKDSAKSMKDEYEQKEKLRDQLKANYEKLKGGNKRSIYTKRILEIISNVDKQNLEISKILEDTRQLQKEINSLEGQLDRCFSIADETLFGDARKDDQAKKAYKLLALLHSECNTIVSLINDTGTLSREIVDLEDNIKAEQVKRTEDTLQRIQMDLTKIQEESCTM